MASPSGVESVEVSACAWAAGWVEAVLYAMLYPINAVKLQLFQHNPGSAVMC